MHILTSAGATMSKARRKEHRRDPRVAAEIDVILKFPSGEQ